MAEERKERCGTCKWFEAGGEKGRCHFNPPQVTTSGRSEAEWPVVRPGVQRQL